MEAAPFLPITFHVFKEHGTHFEHEGNCELSAILSGLKGDLAPEFGIPPAQQHWYYKDKLLYDDGKTLCDYGIETTDECGTKGYVIKIEVKLC